MRLILGLIVMSLPVWGIFSTIWFVDGLDVMLWVLSRTLCSVVVVVVFGYAGAKIINGG